MKEINLYDYDLLKDESHRNPYDHETLSHAEVEVFNIDPDLAGQLEEAK